MLTTEVEKRLTTIISWGALLTTLLVTDRVSLEPANLGKMLVLATTAGATLSVILLNKKVFFLNQRVRFFQ